MRCRPAWSRVTVALGFGAFALCVAPAGHDAAAAPPRGTATFDRMVVIIEQDHTYDSYFRSYEPPSSGAPRGSLTTPGIHALADHYVLFDRYFASSPAGTLGNMLDLMTGDTHGLQISSKETLTELSTLDVPTVFDRMNAAGVDWRLYVGDLAGIDPAKIADGSYLVPGTPVPASLYRAPVLAMRRTWTDPALSSRIVDQDAFFADSRAGTLPQVSFVLPSPTDHPGQPGFAGETRLLSLVNAVQKGEQWPTTAVFVTWDDGGGQFDRVAPPVGSGQRVPLLLISAYAKAGYIDNADLDHHSLLHLIETRFDLDPLVTSEQDPTGFDDAFADRSTPRAPMVLSRSSLPPTPVGTPHQNLRTAALYVAGFCIAASVALFGWSRQRQRATS